MAHLPVFVVIDEDVFHGELFRAGAERVRRGEAFREERPELAAEGVRFDDRRAGCGQGGRRFFRRGEAERPERAGEAFFEGPRRAFGNEFSLLEESYDVAVFRFIHEMGGHKDSGPAAGNEAGEEVPEEAPRCGIDGGGGLVENEELRLVEDGAGQGEALPLAAGEAARLDAAAVSEVHQGKGFLDFSSRRAPERP